jgi:biopolymer transport protein ExbB/TolQ
MIENITWYDIGIVGLGVINFVIFFRLRKYTNKLYEYNNGYRNKKLSRKGRENLKKYAKKEEIISECDLLNYREKMNGLYSLYINNTTIFPLLGMLGTVLALIPMVDEIGASNVSDFFAALTSTAIGIIMAIIFKLFDAFIAWKIEDVEKSLEHIIYPVDDNDKESIE